MKPFWTVGPTHTNCEKQAIENLKRQEYNYYQPKIQEQRKVRNQWKMVELPLFPCYLFIHIEERWRSLNSTYGLSSIIMTGNKPAIVRDEVIEDLKSREKNGYVQLPKKYGVDDQVMITKGPLAGQLALVERMPTKDRQKILLALLANRISVLVDEDDIGTQ